MAKLTLIYHSDNGERTEASVDVGNIWDLEDLGEGLAGEILDQLALERPAAKDWMTPKVIGW